MIRRFLYVGGLYLLFHALYCFPAYADEWTVYEGDFWEVPEQAHVLDLSGYDDFDVWTEAMDAEMPEEEATPSEATPSRAKRALSAPVEISPFSSYSAPYDGSISTSVLTYFQGMVEKLPTDSHYVLFRQSIYGYRLVYGSDLRLTGSNFSGTGLSYVTYDTSTYRLQSGSEGNFSLSAGTYLVYSDLGSVYPVLVTGVRNYEFKALFFLCALYLLFMVYRAFFSPTRITI
ncbi:MAG: hypothetical protein ACRC36_18855 [Lacrimispora sphenoides]